MAEAGFDSQAEKRFSRGKQEINFEFEPAKDLKENPGKLKKTAEINPVVLKGAYHHCRQNIKKGSKGFYFSTLFLPPSKRQAMWAIYNFCRYTDDLVDKNPETPLQVRKCLDHWEQELQQTFAGKTSKRPQLIAWSHTVSTYSIPLEPHLELFEGVRMDLVKSRYATFDELRLYCYRVASTVGLLASAIIGYSDPVALDYAVELGIAMQLTNILRDVGEDLQNGRIYLPLEELARFGYSEEELKQGTINEAFLKLMQFQIARARAYFARALPGIEFLDKDCRLAIYVAAEQYSRILNRIEQNNYDVFNRRAFVPLSEKFNCLARVWWQRRNSRQFSPSSSGNLKSPSEMSSGLAGLFPLAGEEADG